VLRSIDFGTKRVHHRLNPGRAMTLCWIAKTDMSSRSIMIAWSAGPGAPLLIVLGTTNPDTNPIA
jgi:hypothetical protein